VVKQADRLGWESGSSKTADVKQENNCGDQFANEAQL